MYSNYGGGGGGGYGGPPGQNYQPGAPTYMPGQPSAPGQYGQPGGYGQSFGGGVSPEVQQWFNAVDSDRSGKIDAAKLQAALVNGDGKQFSEGVCRLMINMFDKDKNGTIDVQEFQDLYNYINNWINCFKSYDKDGSGNIEENELSAALQTMGYRFSHQFYENVFKRSDPGARRRMTVDQFIQLCVQLQRFTENFRAKDMEQRGQITIGYEEYLNIALECCP